MTVFLCLLIHVPSMASSSDDSEGSLTPVDFIQLQHYMECMFFLSLLPSLTSVHCVSWKKSGSPYHRVRCFSTLESQKASIIITMALALFLLCMQHQHKGKTSIKFLWRAINSKNTNSVWARVSVFGLVCEEKVEQELWKSWNGCWWLSEVMEVPGAVCTVR